MDDQQLIGIEGRRLAGRIISSDIRPRPHPMHLYVRVCTPPLNMMKKLPPAREGLAGPDPEAAGDADDHGHQVLDHEDLEVRLPAEVASPVAHGAGDRVELLGARAQAHLHVPGEHPVVEVGLLVEEAGDDDEGGHRVQDGEYPDAYHELLQLVGLRAVVFHDRADAEERDEAREEEGRPEDEVHAEGGQDEASERLDVPEADVAHARQYVTC
jgi:hypothetical protein